MTYREAAIRFLKERGPLHYQELAEAVVAAGAVQVHGATPAATLNATIAVDTEEGEGQRLHSRPARRVRAARATRAHRRGRGGVRAGADQRGY